MISIIVPVYNTGKYLQECLDSLIAQSYSDIEIIVVDDGSTDDSYLICKKYTQKDSRIRIFHKDNSGVSDARNFGIEHARGEYISFCDSDDRIAPKLYELLLNTMEVNNVDRVVSGYAYLYDDGHVRQCKARVPDGKYNAHDILRKMIDDGTLSGFLFSGVYNSLFKKKIIDDNNIRFDSMIRYNEDSLFSFKYMLHSNALYSLQSHVTYFYRQHNSSVTKKRSVGDKYEPLRKALYCMNLEKMDIDFESQMKRRTVTEALWQILDIAIKERNDKALDDIKAILKDENLQDCLRIINPKELSIYKRFFFYLMKWRFSSTIYFVSSKLYPILSKYLSR